MKLRQSQGQRDSSAFKVAKHHYLNLLPNNYVKSNVVRLAPRPIIVRADLVFGTGLARSGGDPARLPGSLACFDNGSARLENSRAKPALALAPGDNGPARSGIGFVAFADLSPGCDKDSAKCGNGPAKFDMGPAQYYSSAPARCVQWVLPRFHLAFPKVYTVILNALNADSKSCQ